MSLLLLFSSVLVPSCGLLVPAWPLFAPLWVPGPQNGSQNGFQNGPFLKPATTQPHSPGLSHFLCCFLGVGGSFGRSTAAETPLFDISSLLLFVPHFVLGHPEKKRQDSKNPTGTQLLSLSCGRGWGVPSVGPASLLTLLLNPLASSCSYLTSFSATYFRPPLPLRFPSRFRLHGRAPTPESRGEPILRLIMLGSIFGYVFLRFLDTIFGSLFRPLAVIFRCFFGSIF